MPKFVLRLTLANKVKMAVAELTPSPAIISTVRLLLVGTLKVALKLPILFVATVAGDVTTEAPAQVMVIGWLALNPVPLMVSLLPTIPELGEIFINCRTDRVAEAL